MRELIEPKTENQKPFIQTLNGIVTEKIPFWFMRQAGRYLPEYRELRKDTGSFLDLVYNPQKAAEVTIQPLRRFNMDGAILFSDILVTPHAMGQKLRFEEGRGPVLEAITDKAGIENLDENNPDEILSPIYETIQLTKEKLKQEGFDQTALIGFAGGPWTVACYMVEGGSSKDFKTILNWQKINPDEFQILIDRVTNVTIHYLKKQIEAGAEAIQLFDSWSGLLDAEEFERWVIKPTQKIFTELKATYPEIPLIGFPRGAGNNLAAYAETLPMQGIGLDYDVGPDWALEKLPENLVFQGNLHPELLLQGRENMVNKATEILDKFSSRPFIFNLGHGVIKETPVEHVAQLSDLIRNFER